MESGFTSDSYEYSDSTWQRIPHHGSGRFEFFKVRLFGAMHFVKRPASRYANDLQTTESLRKEFNLGYNLGHPGIVKYLRMEKGAVFQEYVDGLSLQQMIERDDDRLKSPKFIEQLCRQLLEATDYLHSHGVIHNDIKAENVMITRIGNQVKIVDLGASTSDLWDATEGFTDEWKAPEQGTHPTNVYTDIYLIGRLMETLAPIAGVGGRWRKFIKKATSEAADSRFLTDREALDAIPVISRHRGWSVAVVALIILMAVVGISIYWSHRENYETDSTEILTDTVPLLTESPQIEEKVEKQTNLLESNVDVRNQDKSQNSNIMDKSIAGDHRPSRPYDLIYNELGESIEVYDAVDAPAEFPGGENALESWLHENTTFTYSGEKNNKRGRVWLYIVIDANGNVIKLKIDAATDDNESLKQEALRLISIMPRWVPAKIAGRNVASEQYLEISL